MLGGITLGQFVPANSLLHRLDPRTKVIGVLAAATSVLAAANWQGFTLAAGLTIAAIALSGLPVRMIIGGLRSLWVLLIIAFLLQAFLTPGEAVAGLGPLQVTREGLEAGGQIFLRLGFLILVASLLTLTTPPISLTAGMESMLSPLKRIGVPAHELAMMMTIALRFIPTLLEEAQTLVRSQRSRGAEFSALSPKKMAANLLPLFVPLFAGALRRAEDLATAMEARCYRGGTNRTRIRALKFDRRDYAAITVVLAVLAGVVALRSIPL